MAKYKVTLYYTTHVEVEVEASSKDEAEELGWEEAGKSKYDCPIAGNCEHDFADVELLSGEGEDDEEQE